MSDVVVVIGAGSIGQAIARRVASGRTVLLSDLRPEAAERAAQTLLDAGFEVQTAQVDVASAESVRALARRADGMGDVTHVIQTAGVSPAQAPPQTVIAVDLVGTALVLEEFGRIIAPGGAGIVISSQAGHMIPPLPAEQNQALANAPVEELADLPFVQAVENSMAAYCLAKRANSLRVQAQALAWGERGARLNAMSPGIIMTPLAREELESPAAQAYRTMIETSPARRVGTPDEIGEAAAFLMRAGFVTGSDLLIDGGVIAAMAGGRLNLDT